MGFRPTAENYFGRVSRTLIMGAMTGAGLPSRTRLWSKMKKADLAVMAEREMAETGWLPQPLRPVDRAVSFNWLPTKGKLINRACSTTTFVALAMTTPFW
jgi:hypothetical protein